MKAKGFKEWIGESKVREDWTGAKLWFDESTDFGELLGQGIWQLKARGSAEDELFKQLEQIEQDLQVTAKPIGLTRRGPADFGNWALYFSLDKWVSVGKMDQWSVDNLSNSSAEVFKSSAGGVDWILLRGGRDLTSDQLVQLLEWLQNREISRNYLADITEQIKSHPNWPEDLTDWVLSDW